MRVRDAATWLIAPAVLVAVAVVQFWRVAEHDQSSWSGIGFGMFATFEEEANRFLVVTVEIEGRRLVGRVPPDLVDEARHLLTVPARGATQSVAQELAGRRWRVTDLGQAIAVETGGATPERVTVRVLGVAVDGGDDPRLRQIVVREAVAER